MFRFVSHSSTFKDQLILPLAALHHLTEQFSCIIKSKTATERLVKLNNIKLNIAKQHFYLVIVPKEE